MRRLGPAAAAAIAAALVLAGCGSDSDSAAELSAGSAYMPQPVTGDMAAGFLTITNKGGTKDELTSVTSDAAADVTVHKTAGGTMQEAGRLTIPAHGRLVFQSGGNHLMFEKLKRTPKQGQTVSVELHFAHSDPLKVAMPVKSATYTPTTGH
ncbi:copper chaperone PCu(A)C [Streptomyces sp. S.PNR 29]|uniref:copper chaperone PCu(A)C n=1 Tax=Streptomyces sp. S.PNR 29 TaxID=2973805 RepID=UPI0025AF9CC9|nr:copper chaperone PCu(A)C [Streptomyces sp. S.PNR 29]MDN0199387.1 copper chaperone PCu(A)C [Streptomyces sp. S.PNR 29]